MQNEVIRQSFNVEFTYPVWFTEGVFDKENPLLANEISRGTGSRPSRVLVVLDEGVEKAHPDVVPRTFTYFDSRVSGTEVVRDVIRLPGGEEAKNDPGHYQRILNAIENHHLDRHSTVLAIGGGAVIDVAGYAASIAHRGIRLIRIPTTVLAQNDAAVGVKNGVNSYGKKNFLGTFATPFAVLNDLTFLQTLDERDWRSGISEAVKVALIKDRPFFEKLEETAVRLVNRDLDAMKSLIIRCADLHLNHIATSGDPFETGSSRPLDFGHWSAHKLEQMTGYELRHGEAVAVGIALDAAYSHLSGKLAETSLDRILDLFLRLGFTLHPPVLESHMNRSELMSGLQEFREHLGGELTIMLLEGIGSGVEVHQVDEGLYLQAIELVSEWQKENV